ncbi:CARDB domain-containing protein [Flavilitoribacter nigricans]|uniref:CARDB domain-containing protein n=1 Tax=Flavilitoribacter nigricans (strain ATCC 23147 / DSM 23189 / NBRC 102662 / NCIMB 1420 / SS-2) TaxID=1122177 RepID=A0A2D0N0C0_FLAN2|nr:CARDB domain-containing protein [Flavilitoribacter nigricans]PHN01971.1 hypothetical protein CRP01_34260 [Flavilitoribacter nigricans DSM 23189 = NBRC 102662]
MNNRINNGNAPAGASTLRYYLSIDESFATAVYEVGNDPVGILLPGGASNESITIDVSTVGIPAGAYFIAYFIDADGVVTEKDETDNGFYWTYPQVTTSSTVCQDIDLIQDETLLTSTHVFRAQNTITAYDVVFTGFSASYHAGESITFGAGTHFWERSTVVAKIADCTPVPPTAA